VSASPVPVAGTQSSTPVLPTARGRASPAQPESASAQVSADAAHSAASSAVAAAGLAEVLHCFFCCRFRNQTNDALTIRFLVWFRVEGCS
jgi:hypothetical protein